MDIAEVKKEQRGTWEISWILLGTLSPLPHFIVQTSQIAESKVWMEEYYLVKMARSVIQGGWKFKVPFANYHSWKETGFNFIGKYPDPVHRTPELQRRRLRLLQRSSILDYHLTRPFSQNRKESLYLWASPPNCTLQILFCSALKQVDFWCPYVLCWKERIEFQKRWLLFLIGTVQPFIYLPFSLGYL